MQNQFLPDEKYAALPVQKELAVTLSGNETETVPQENAALTALLTQTKQKLRKRQRQFGTRMLVGTAAFITCLTLPLKLIEPTTWQASLGLVAFISLFTFLYIGFLVVAAGSFAFDPEELARLGGVRAIGPLLDAFSAGVTPKQRKALYAALIPLLRQMKASDAPLLTPAHRKFLYMSLRSEPFETPRVSDSLAFRLAILKALEQVGDEKALPVVQRLANLKGRSARWRQIRDAARECLPHLQAHSAEITTNLTLLRASSAETATPETLLRPAANGNETPSEQLLRASDVS